MTTLAAIDRVVHHSVILDLMGMDSYRAQEASAQHESSISNRQASVRYLGEQRCSECNRFCQVVGLGGACQDCEQPVLLSDLLDLEV